MALWKDATAPAKEAPPIMTHGKRVCMSEWKGARDVGEERLSFARFQIDPPQTGGRFRVFGRPA